VVDLVLATDVSLTLTAFHAHAWIPISVLLPTMLTNVNIFVSMAVRCFILHVKTDGDGHLQTVPENWLDAMTKCAINCRCVITTG
jgi:hypothetical protein